MGLESQVQEVLRENDPTIVYGSDYWFDNGLRINMNLERNERDLIAESIMSILDESGEFGPTRCNEDSTLIEFGKHESLFSDSFEEYVEYCNDFWSGIKD